MKLVYYELASTVVLDFGLRYPERVQLHAHTWIGRAGNLYNILRGRSILYVVWKYNVHLTTVGLTADWLSRIETAKGRPAQGLKRINIRVLRDLLKEAERSKWKALRQSFRYSHA